MSAEDNLQNRCPGHVYVHVPFCARRCSYCDFSIAVRREIPVKRFIDAIKAELVTRRISPAHGGLKSLYLGGGTPSKLGAGVGEITQLVSTVAQVGVAELGEVTVEANPEDISPGVVRAWREAGVNRVSLGAQSFDDDVLAWMHRTHTARHVATAVEVLEGEGIPQYSLDLIFAVPDALRRDWVRDIEQAIALQPGHLSVYGLTVEAHTPLARWEGRGGVRQAGEERYEAEFLEAHRRLGEAGFVHYEVSNYAKPGEAAVHNSSYWRGASCLGLGPAAHGFDGERRRWNARGYARWLDLVEGGVDPIEGDEVIWPAEHASERIYLGLRTLEGLAATGEEFSRAARWITEGWARRAGDRLVLTETGWLRLDALAVAIAGA